MDDEVDEAASACVVEVNGLFEVVVVDEVVLVVPPTGRHCESAGGEVSD